MSNYTRMAIEVGQLAPPFSLFDTTRQKVSLADYAGRPVVLLFFPFAFSRLCTRELCEMRDDYSFFEALQAEVIGISVDSLYTNARFKEENRLNFPLLSDFNKDVSRAYDSLLENFAFEYRGVTRRSSFVIDATGHIAYMELLPSPGDYPDLQKLREAVAALK